MLDGQISIRKRLLTGGAWAFAGRILTAVSVLAVNALLARLLSPAEMGDYFLTFSLVGFAAIVAQSGLATTIVRLVAESLALGDHGRARQSIKWVFRIISVSVLVVVLIMVFGGGAFVSGQIFQSPMMGSVVHISALWVVMQVFQTINAETFRGFHDIRLASVFGGLSTGLFTALIFFVLWIFRGHSNLREVVILSTVAGMSTVLLSGVLLGKRFNTLPVGGREISLEEVLTIAWPLWVTSLTLFVLTQADLWVLGLFRDQDEVAIYGVAVRLVALIAMPLTIVNAVMQPVISDMYSRGKLIQLEKIMRASGTLVAIPAFTVLGLFVVFGDTILGYFFGEFYRGAGLVLLILSTGQLINVWAGSCGLALMLTGNQMLMMKISIVTGLLTILSSLLLVERYGSTGVAGAAALGIILQNILMLLAVRKKLQIWTHADYRYVTAMVKRVV